MILLFFASLIVLPTGSFIVDATAEKEFSMPSPSESVFPTGAEIELLRRHMPGVVNIQDLGGQRFLYQTERSMPFSGVVHTDFIIHRNMLNDSTVAFRTPESTASNYLSIIFSGSRAGTYARVRIRLRVRMVRDDPSEIHILAPLLGSDFISDRMEDDLDRMLEEFVQNIERERERSTMVAGEESP